VYDDELVEVDDNECVCDDVFNNDVWIGDMDVANTGAKIPSDVS